MIVARPDSRHVQAFTIPSPEDEHAGTNLVGSLDLLFSSLHESPPAHENDLRRLVVKGFERHPLAVYETARGRSERVRPQDRGQLHEINESTLLHAHIYKGTFTQRYLRDGSVIEVRSDSAIGDTYEIDWATGVANFAFTLFVSSQSMLLHTVAAWETICGAQKRMDWVKNFQ